jgi:hypothetical protein
MQLLPTCPLGGALFERGGATAAHGKESVIRHKDGYLAYVLINASILRNSEGDALSLTAFVTDITDRKQAEICLQELATHDTLTGPPNRTHVNQRLQQRLNMELKSEVVYDA